MPNVAPKTRTLSLREVQVLLDWAALEGWNPGLHDAPAFHACDPEGFIGAFVDGEMVAGISAVAYGAHFGFIGLYICRPDMRGRGYGKAVWDAGMARLAGHTIGLDGVPAQQDNYRRMGFWPVYRTFRYSGIVSGSTAAPASIAPITPELLPAIAAFDRLAFPAPRAAFLARWVTRPHRGVVYRVDGAVRGYCVVRPCRAGHKVGPLFATEHVMSRALLLAVAQSCGGELHIDVPEGNLAFIEFLKSAGMTRGFETARMYLGPAPSISLDLVAGVTSLELG